MTGSRPLPPLWACVAVALGVTAVGVGSTLIPRRLPDDAFRARLAEYRRIGETIGRSAPVRPAP